MVDSDEDDLEAFWERTNRKLAALFAPGPPASVDSKTLRESRAAGEDVTGVAGAGGTGFARPLDTRHGNVALQAHNGTIYKITSPSGKAYIGQTTQVLRKRMDAHLKRSNCWAVHSAITKYGWKNMCVEVLLSELDHATLDAREDEMIEKHNTRAPNGYNLIKVCNHPYRAGNLANCSTAVRRYHANHPGAARVKQNNRASVQHQRGVWREKLMHSIAELLDVDMRKARLKISSAKCAAKYVAKQAAKRCAGTGRDPMEEWQEHWGVFSIDDIITQARAWHAPSAIFRGSPA
jgi:group I intron endonuclease